MLRKRTRSHQKDRHMFQLTSDVSESYFHSDIFGRKHKDNSFFNVPSLFVGFNPKGSESDSVRSPTSPLDFRVFSNLGNPFRSQRSPRNGHQKIWDSNKVGLSIIDSLDCEAKQSGKVLRASDSKNILFGPQMRIKILNSESHNDYFGSPKSLPKNVKIFPYTNTEPSNLQEDSSDVLFEIGDTSIEAGSFGNFRPCSLDSGGSGSCLSRLAKKDSYLRSRNFISENGTGPVTLLAGFIRGSKSSSSSDAEQIPIPTPIGSGNGLIGTIPPSEIKLSEDYTCVRIHGPNPKVTHIFGDCILECHTNELANFGNKSEEGIVKPRAAECSKAPILYPSSDFLSLCYSCKKKLDGEDIYMYRGEKAFCSWNCRLQEILIDEELEEGKNDGSKETAELGNLEEFPGTVLFIST